MLAPPRSKFLVKNHCKLQGIMKYKLFTTLLAMVFNTAFLLQRCLKLLASASSAGQATSYTSGCPLAVRPWLGRYAKGRCLSRLRGCRFDKSVQIKVLLIALVGKPTITK